MRVVSEVLRTTEDGSGGIAVDKKVMTLMSCCTKQVGRCRWKLRAAGSPR